MSGIISIDSCIENNKEILAQNGHQTGSYHDFSPVVGIHPYQGFQVAHNFGAKWLSLFGKLS